MSAKTANSEPFLFDQISEPARALFEICAGENPLSRWFVSSSTASGNGAPVMLIPGLATDGNFFLRLGEFLREKNHRTYDWGQGFNMGRSHAPIRKVEEKLHSVFEQNDGQPVSFVGYSLGGLFAEALAARNPEMTGHVITLASPINLEILSNPNSSVGRSVHEHFNDHVRAQDPKRAGPMLELLAEFKAQQARHGITTTHIYTSADGVIGPEAGFDHEPGPHTENIRVSSSHVGIVSNLEVQRLVAEILARPARDENAPGVFAG